MASTLFDLAGRVAIVTGSTRGIAGLQRGEPPAFRVLERQLGRPVQDYPRSRYMTGQMLVVDGGATI